MVQTEHTAIVLRHVNYRDNDRMVTLFSPSRGRIDAVIRNCRKPKSHNLNAGELFALGDYMLYESGGHTTVTSVHLIETFYALREDYEDQPGTEDIARQLDGLIRMAEGEI